MLITNFTMCPVGLCWYKGRIDGRLLCVVLVVLRRAHALQIVLKGDVIGRLWAGDRTSEKGGRGETKT